jgi:hypothetical protein
MATDTMDPERDKPAVVVLRKPRRVRGLVAVFDVLGFKSFCQHNTDQRVAEEVLTTIDLVPEGMLGILSHTLSRGKNTEKLHELISSIIWLVFSDTILATLPQSEEARLDMEVIYFGACAILNRLMFDRGLPLRGSVQLGEFLLGNRCVSGRIIVEALDQVNDLETACTVISNDVWTYVHHRFHDNKEWAPFILGMLPRHSIRCKSGIKTFTTLNWFNVGIGNTPDPPDMDKYVMDSFLAHGKQLSASAFKKARDTVVLFEKFTKRLTSQPPTSAGENQGGAIEASGN